MSSWRLSFPNVCGCIVSDVLPFYPGSARPTVSQTLFRITHTPKPSPRHFTSLPANGTGTIRTHSTGTNNTDTGTDFLSTVEEKFVNPLRLPELVGPGESDFMSGRVTCKVHALIKKGGKAVAVAHRALSSATPDSHGKNRVSPLCYYNNVCSVTGPVEENAEAIFAPKSFLKILWSNETIISQ